MRAPIETTNLWDPLNQDTSEGKGRRSMAKRTASSARIVALPDADDDSFREQSYLKTVKPRTANQEALMTAIDAHSLTLAVGPAGTGKTYLAVTKAVEAMNAGRISRIVITRPVVEAGESLGFLPGDINEKMDPWMRPIYDALSDRLGARQVRQMTKDGTVEIAPLAYMRGRTISRSFVIVDEAQNMTFQQIKMLLTRLGWHSTMVITGDPDQTDLLPGMSGLEEAVRRLQPLEDIAIVRLTTQDIVQAPAGGRDDAAAGVGACDCWATAQPCGGKSRLGRGPHQCTFTSSRVYPTPSFVTASFRMPALRARAATSPSSICGWMVPSTPPSPTILGSDSATFCTPATSGLTIEQVITARSSSEIAWTIRASPPPMPYHVAPLPLMILPAAPRTP